MGSSTSTPDATPVDGPAVVSPSPDAPRLDIAVFTIFPQLIDAFAGESLLGKAQRGHLVRVRTH